MKRVIYFLRFQTPIGQERTFIIAASYNFLFNFFFQRFNVNAHNCKVYLKEEILPKDNRIQDDYLNNLRIR